MLGRLSAKDPKVRDLGSPKEAPDAHATRYGLGRASLGSVATAPDTAVACTDKRKRTNSPHGHYHRGVTFQVWHPRRPACLSVLSTTVSLDAACDHHTPRHAARWFSQFANTGHGSGVTSMDARKIFRNLVLGGATLTLGSVSCGTGPSGSDAGADTGQDAGVDAGAASTGGQDAGAGVADAGAAGQDAGTATPSCSCTKDPMWPGNDCGPVGMTPVCCWLEPTATCCP